MEVPEVTETTEMDYEKITIYPLDYDADKRRELLSQLKRLGINFSYENWC
jgi:hypothetical protein